MKSSASSEEEVTDENDAVDDDISDVEEHLVNDARSSQPRIFQLSFVNIYGNAEVNRLSDDDKQIKFGRK